MRVNFLCLILSKILASWCRFWTSWSRFLVSEIQYSASASILALGGKFRLFAGVPTSLPDLAIWALIMFLLPLEVNFWPLCTDYGPSKVHLGPLEVDFWSQDVDVGHLVVDFGPPIVNFRVWELILSLSELFLFLWGVNLRLRGVDFVPGSVVLRSLGVNFLPLKVDFWLLGLDFSHSEYVLSLWKGILIFGSRFWEYMGRIWPVREKSRKSAWSYRLIEKKSTFGELKKYSILQARFEKKLTLGGYW